MPTGALARIDSLGLGKSVELSGQYGERSNATGVLAAQDMGFLPIPSYILAADGSDIAPSVFRALLAVQANKTGIVDVSARSDGLNWSQVTAANCLWQTVGNLTPPGFCWIRGNGTPVVLAVPANAFPAYFVIDNTSGSTFFEMTGMVFIGGVPGADDVPRVLNASAAKVLLRDIQCYGVQGRDGFGLFDLAVASSISVLDCRFGGCNRPTTGTGGLVSINGGSLLVDNTDFLDSAVFNNVFYQKGSPDSFIFIRGANHPVAIRACQFGQVFTDSAIHYAVALGNPASLLQIVGCFLQVNSNPGAGSAPSVHVEGAPGFVPCPGVVYENCTLGDVGGHRTFQQPQLVQQSKGAGPTIFRGCTVTSSLAGSLTPPFDANLLPAKGFRPMGGGSGSFVTDNCTGPNPQMRLRPFFDTEAPIFSETYNGLTTLYPANSSLSFFDASEQVTFSLGATLTGAGATYAAVTPNHTLTITATPTGTLTVTFNGTENNQATFLASLNAQLAPVNGIQAVNSGGQIQLQAGLMYGASSGAILSGSADVLASLGLAVGNFATLARVSNLGDQAAGTNPLTGASSQRSIDANVNNEWSLPFLAGSNDSLVSGPVVINQPFTVFLVGRQNDIVAARYAFDGGAADQCSIQAPIAHNAVTTNAGLGVATNVADTRVPFILIWTVNGANSNVRINSDAPGATINTGANNLSKITLGNKGGAAPASAGWDIACARIQSGAVTLQQARAFNAWASRRYNIPLLG